MNTIVRLAVDLLAIAAAASGMAPAQRVAIPLQELVGPSALEAFGSSLALDGDTLAVGATEADGAVSRCGVVYVFVRSGGGWVQQARLVASDAETQAQFGSSVSLRGDVLAVGTPHPGNVGRAYVFRRVGATWSEEANLPSPATGVNPLYGTSVIVLDDSVLVSAANTHGVVYRFDRIGTSWSLAQTITPADPSFNQWFGQAMAVDGSRLMVGAHNSVLPGDDAIYAFDLVGGAWVQEAKIQPPGLVHAGLGSSLALQGDTLFFGCAGADVFGQDAGAAFFWTRTAGGWIESGVLQDCVPDGSFGAAVDIDGDTALVAAPFDDEAGPFLGSLKVFRRENDAWSLETKVVLPDAYEDFSYMGPSLLAGDRVFLASPQASVSRGRVVEFQLVPSSYPTVCVATPENDLCAPCFDGSLMRGGCENGAVNCGTQIGASGLASMSAVGLVLRARGLPLYATAVLFQGTALDAPLPFGAGRLCVGGGIQRIAQRAASSGQWTYPRAGDAPISVAGSIPAGGGVRHYQLAYRDVKGFCGGEHANATNGVSVTWAP